MFDRLSPHNSLPRLPPMADVESKSVLRALVAAHRALADLKGVARLLPNQAILLRAILLQEARLSSEIENIVTTNDELYRAFSSDGDRTDVHTREVMRYEEAIWHGYRALGRGPLTTESLIALAAIIIPTSQGLRTQPGTRIASAAGEIVYTPPVGRERIHELLDNLMAYLHSDGPGDVLVRICVAHYQFEAIHPFRDGNGRAGRVANVLYLVEHGLLELPVLYLSRHIIYHKPEYYRLLRGVTESQAWEPWLQFMLEAVELTAIETRNRVLSVRRLLDSTIEEARARLPRHIYSRELLELVFEQPYTRIGFLERAGIAKRQTASEYLRALEQAGIVTSRKAGRDMLYVNDRLLAALCD